MGIKDANNMGAAMAGAAYDTINRHLLATGTSPADYDVIYTGDLGQVGSELMCELFRRDGTEISHKHKDCGLMLYDRENRTCTQAAQDAAAVPRYCADISCRR